LAILCCLLKLRKNKVTLGSSKDKRLFSTQKKRKTKGKSTKGTTQNKNWEKKKKFTITFFSRRYYH